MTCPRCNGLMLMEQFIESHYLDLPDEFEGWRCVLCGIILDPVIVENRGASHERSMRNEVRDNA